MVILCFVARMIIEDNIDGGTFIKLPCDKRELKQELKLTRDGANKFAKLLSEAPGPDHKGRWMGRGPYKLLAIC